MKLSARILCSMAAALASLCIGEQARAVDTNSTARPGGFQFDGKISRQVLENYLSRSICVEGMLNGRGPLADDIRMLTNCGAKYVARALCLWGAENDFLDFHAFPLRIKETPQTPQEATLEVGFTDAIYGRSKGGKTFSG